MRGGRYRLPGLGFLFTLAARQHLPLLIVQACVVDGLAVTAIIQHVAGTRRIGARDWLAIFAVSAGILGLATTTVPGPAVPITTTFRDSRKQLSNSGGKHAGTGSVDPG